MRVPWSGNSSRQLEWTRCFDAVGLKFLSTNDPVRLKPSFKVLMFWKNRLLGIMESHFQSIAFSVSTHVPRGNFTQRTKLKCASWKQLTEQWHISSMESKHLEALRSNKVLCQRNPRRFYRGEHFNEVQFSGAKNTFRTPVWPTSIVLMSQKLTRRTLLWLFAVVPMF